MRSLKRSKNRDTFPLTLFFQKRSFFVLSYPRRALCVQRVSLSSHFSVLEPPVLLVVLIFSRRDDRRRHALFHYLFIAPKPELLLRQVPVILQLLGVFIFGGEMCAQFVERHHAGRDFMRWKNVGYVCFEKTFCGRFDVGTQYRDVRRALYPGTQFHRRGIPVSRPAGAHGHALWAGGHDRAVI